MSTLKMLSCDHLGNLKFGYGEHTITTNCNKIFKWHSETLGKENKEIVKDVEHQILCYKRTMEKGAKRVWIKN